MKRFIYELRIRRVRHSYAAEAKANPSIIHPATAAAVLRHIIGGEARECFVVLCVSAQNRMLGYEMVSIGTLDTVPVHPREVFRSALLASAAGIVVGHNHPSGDSTPSDHDEDLTERLRSCGSILGIPLLDHIIVTETGYHSFSEHGFFDPCPLRPPGTST